MTPGQAQWAMFLFGVVCGWITVSIIGVPALAWLLASLHRDEILSLRVENCTLRRRVEELGE